MTVQEVFKFNSHNAEEHTPNTLVKSEVIGIPHNEEIEIEVHNLVSETITIKDERQNEIIEVTCPNSDVKTEIDLIPITEIDVNDKGSDFEEVSDDDCCVVKENVYINETKVSLDNIVLFKSEGHGKHDEKVISSNITLGQSDKNICSDDDDFMDLNDDVVSNVDDNDDSTKVVNNEVVSKKKTIEVKKKKAAVKKANADDDVVIWVKGRR